MKKIAPQQDNVQPRITIALLAFYPLTENADNLNALKSSPSGPGLRANSNHWARNSYWLLGEGSERSASRTREWGPSRSATPRQAAHSGAGGAGLLGPVAPFGPTKKHVRGCTFDCISSILHSRHRSQIRVLIFVIVNARSVELIHSRHQRNLADIHPNI